MKPDGHHDESWKRIYLVQQPTFNSRIEKLLLTRPGGHAFLLGPKDTSAVVVEYMACVSKGLASFNRGPEGTDAAEKRAAMWTVTLYLLRDSHKFLNVFMFA